jgi:hypothetical protein
MVSVSKTKAERQYAEIQKKDKTVTQTIQSDAQIRLEKSAQLRQLRLAAEAREATDKLAIEKLTLKGRKNSSGAPKKPRVQRDA